MSWYHTDADVERRPVYRPDPTLGYPGILNNQLGVTTVEGVVRSSGEKRAWVAAVDWSAVRHASDVRSTTKAG